MATPLRAAALVMLAAAAAAKPADIECAGSVRVDRHCMCLAGSRCMGSRCTSGHRSGPTVQGRSGGTAAVVRRLLAQHVVYGYDPLRCADCKCQPHPNAIDAVAHTGHRAGPPAAEPQHAYAGEDRSSDAVDPSTSKEPPVEGGTKVTQASIDAREELGLHQDPAFKLEPGWYPSSVVPQKGIRVFYDVYAMEEHGEQHNYSTSSTPHLLGDILHAAAYECADKFKSYSDMNSWYPDRNATAGDCQHLVDINTENNTAVKCCVFTTENGGSCHMYRGISGRSLREYEPFQLQSGTIAASLKSVQEQLSLAQRHHTIDFTTIGSRINVLAVCREQDARLGRPLECIDSGHRREGGAEVTLGRLHTFCSAHPEDTVAYIHNRGGVDRENARQPGRDTVMRRFSTRGVLSNECSRLTRNASAAACTVCSSHVASLPFLHTTGNMFVAQCGYISKLLPPDVFGEKMSELHVALGVAVPDRIFPSGQAAAEHWAHSHPSVLPCDLYDGPFTWNDPDRMHTLEHWVPRLETAPRHLLAHYCFAQIGTGSTERLMNMCVDPTRPDRPDTALSWGMAPRSGPARWNHAYGIGGGTRTDAAQAVNPPEAERVWSCTEHDSCRVKWVSRNEADANAPRNSSFGAAGFGSYWGRVIEPPRESQAPVRPSLGATATKHRARIAFITAGLLGRLQIDGIIEKCVRPMIAEGHHVDVYMSLGVQKYDSWTKLQFEPDPKLAEVIKSKDWAGAKTIITTEYESGGATVRRLVIGRQQLSEAARGWAENSTVFEFDVLNTIGSSHSKSTREGMMRHWSAWEALWSTAKANEIRDGEQYDLVWYVKDDAWMEAAFSLDRVLSLVDSSAGDLPAIITFYCPAMATRVNLDGGEMWRAKDFGTGGDFGRAFNMMLNENTIIWDRRAIDAFGSITEEYIVRGSLDIVERTARRMATRNMTALWAVPHDLIPMYRFGRVGGKLCIHHTCRDWARDRTSGDVERLGGKHDVCPVVWIKEARALSGKDSNNSGSSAAANASFANSTHPPQVAADDDDVPLTYKPSEIEVEWASTPRKGQICELGTDQVPRAKVWSDYTRAVFTPKGNRSRDPTQEEQALLSKFVKPDGSVSFIEPLTGIARHPLAVLGISGVQCGAAAARCAGKGETCNCAGKADHGHAVRYGSGASWIEGKTNSAGTIECTLSSFGGQPDPGAALWAVNHSMSCECLPKPDFGEPYGLFDITYLLLENRCGEPEPKPYKRARFFDLGCTYFAEPAGKTYDVLDPDRISHGSGYGPSIPLFYNLYRQHCVDFDDIYAFEGRQLKADDWWSTVPSFLRHRIRFYNTYVEELPKEQSVAGKDLAPEGSFLRMLPQAVSEDDFVVIKIDIDGGPELEIAHALAARPELTKLVDEIYFEYHFIYDGINFGWDNHFIANTSVDTAIELMQQFRRLGVRSHFWI